MLVRLIKLTVSACFWAIDSTRRLICRTLGEEQPATCVVLYYHAVTPKEAERFSKQMDNVVRFAKPISLKNGLQLDSGKHHVAVTFDDGLSHTMQRVLPELVLRKIPATVFVPSGLIGKQPSWIKNHKSPDYHEVVMTADQLKTAKGAGLISIGSHCVTHRSLLSLKEKEAYQEILNSKKTLEAILGERIDLLSFPHGKFHEGHIKIAREAGYRRVFSIVPRLASSGTDEYVTGRVRTDPSDWPFEFRLKLCGAYRWVPFAFKLKKMSRKLVTRYRHKGLTTNCYGR